MGTTIEAAKAMPGAILRDTAIMETKLQSPCLSLGHSTSYAQLIIASASAVYVR